MTAAYPIAANPEPYQILGLKLKPFCLGHCEHMERHGVAFMDSNAKEITVADLLLGVLICSKTYEDFPKFIATENLLEEGKQWLKACGVFSVKDKIALFVEYIRHASQKPMVVFEHEGKQSGSHWIQCIKIGLIELGYTPSEAMNLPLAQAFADYYRAAENAGVLRILCREEAEEIERLEAACRN